MGRKINYKFGDLIGSVLFVHEDGKDKSGKRMLKVQCDCGRVFSTQQGHLKNNNTNTCGRCVKKQYEVGKIYLTNGGSFLCSLEDWTNLIQFNWYSSQAGTNTYAVRTTKIKLKRGFKKESAANRIADRMGMDRQIVDHASRDTLDNRRENLRAATYESNSWNKSKSKLCKSPYKGVTKKPGCPNNPWRARITYKGKQIYLGLHATPELARDAYLEKAKELFGEFACEG